MKLLYCTECHDVFNLRLEEKSCGCGKSKGKYLPNKLHAEYEGPALPLGFTNTTFVEAIKNQPKGLEFSDRMGKTFTAFVIPEKCPTFFKKETIEEFKQEQQHAWYQGYRWLYQCPTCKDKIYSKYDGQFATCSCWENKEGNKGIFVDQTPHYGRVGGPAVRVGSINIYKEKK